MSVLKRTAMASVLVALAAACGRPDFNTDLKTEGPPEVVLVAVTSETLGEAATYCATVEPEKTNGYYCPEEDADQVPPIADATPLGLHVRIAFDELLDPSLETIDEENGVTSLAGTPVDIECGGTALAYGGFYDPSGNHLTFPAGPALVIEPTDAVATGSDCTVTIGGDVKDKDGETVPSGQRGPYDFTISPLIAYGTTPAPDSEGVDPATAIEVEFNNLIAEASLAGNVTLHDDTNNADVPIDAVVSTDFPNVVAISSTAGALDENTAYTATVAAGIEDVQGGALGADVVFSFTTGAAM